MSTDIHKIYQHIRQLLAVFVMSLVISGCEIETDNNVPGVPTTGRYAAVGANQHSGEDTVQVSIAIFDNGTAINLVGGDVVQASTSDDIILLLESGYYTGSYAASLPNTANYDQIDFLMVHKPIEARQARWYPVDILNIDPGPGELVGAAATITLPPAVENLAVSGTLFTSVNDDLVISWTPAGAGDVMKIRSAVSCDNGVKTSTYGIVAKLTDESDDGTETVGLNQFIYDTLNVSLGGDIISGEARALLQETLESLSNGVTENDFFKIVFPINPANNSCEVRLFLFRQRAGSFDSASTNGRIFGSRSADITLNYNPN